MVLSWEEIHDKALVFSKRWEDASNERAEAQVFLHELLAVFGVDSKRVATFEHRVHSEEDTNGYIDLLWPGRILIEMKSRGKSLERAFKQARGYTFAIDKDEDLPEYILVCDFETFRLYRQTTNQQWQFKLKDLNKNIKKLSIFTDQASKFDFIIDKELNTKAAYKMALLHDTLKEHGYIGHNLEVYLVRILFCLFADDSGIFHKKQFRSYVYNSEANGGNLSDRLNVLFDILNTQDNERQLVFSEEVLAFKYINGGLFAETLRPAAFNARMRQLLLECCEFNWSFISPSIFGAMFQGVMDQAKRRELGAHYTSEQNILKLIKPLFLDELYEEFEHVKSNDSQLEHFHKKLSQLTFLDPACGCGNFLIVTYRELRLLELEVLKMQIDNGRQMRIGDYLEDQIKVNVNQFYGIEYEEFPGQIAQVGLWVMDHQMNNIIAEHFGMPFVRLPLRESATIYKGHENGNALKSNWESIIPKNKLNYILGNPPFVGARIMNENQKAEMLEVFSGNKGIGNLDYVSAWYKKAAEFIQGTNIRVGFISTNSIVQGEQVSILWKPLLVELKIQINFAYRSFKWSNEARGNAAVHCVIIGFSQLNKKTEKKIFDYDSVHKVSNINPYLIDAPTILIDSRKKPLCNVPEIELGNMPNDGNGLLSDYTDESKNNLISICPQAEKWFKPFVGAQEFINGYKRWCIWLSEADPAEINKCREIMNIIYEVKKVRLKSKRKETQKLADIPFSFGEIRQPHTNYIVIPRHSSEKRRYIPIGFLEPNIIAGDSVLIIPNSTLYHFGILTSNVHMAWVRTVCGRIKSDYRYSANLVYNNFPWPTPTESQKQAIINSAQEVLDIREIFHDSSMSDLYDPLTMPLKLYKAHIKLDKMVGAAYGMQWHSEADCIEHLMKRYQELITGRKSIERL